MVRLESHAAAVVQLDGALTVATAPDARNALLKAVAEEPDVVVADVSTLTAPEDVVLTLFPAIARHAAAWPGIPLVLAEPGRALVAALDRTAVMRYVAVLSSVLAACASVVATPPMRITDRSPAGPTAVTTARRLVRTACERWGIPGVAETAELIAAELTSNAVRHVGRPLEVCVSLRHRFLHISVRDESREPPRIGRGESRGLLLVDALTTGWGCTEVAGGKVVWATLRLS
jgi:hypothetical protein